jgi:hypothetical protein
MSSFKPVQQDADQMREVAADLAKGAADLASISEAIALAGFPHLHVGNYDQLKRARAYVDNYVHAAKKALRIAREARNDFATPLNGSEKRGRKGS